jgi:hypothetical protein
MRGCPSLHHVLLANNLLSKANLPEAERTGQDVRVRHSS